jgi:hypothetical protein
MVLNVFPKIGTTKSIAEAYTELKSKYSDQDQEYPAQKAAGSLGGAVNGGTIILNPQNGKYVRVR